jgi:hypothetical protein
MQWPKRITGLLWAIGMAVAASTAACGDTPTSPDTTNRTTRLSGTVTEMSTAGRSPVEGAVVTHVATGRSATTDSTGAYSIAEIPAGLATIVATKDGYDTTTRSVTVSGETRLDLELARRRIPPVALSGLVYERTAAGQVPIPGVPVEDSNFHVGSVTDAEGRYRIDYRRFNVDRNYVANLYVAKEGFWPVSLSVAIEGEALLDIELVRR